MIRKWKEGYTYNILVALLIVTAVTLLPINVSATSCKDLEYRIYGICTENACGDIVFIDAELGYGTCSRIPTVKDGSLLHKKILEYEVKLASVSDAGTYELKLTRDWYLPAYNLRQMRDYMVFYKIADLPPYSPATSELRKIRDGSIEIIRKRWVEKSASEKRILNRQLAKASLVFLLALIPLMFSLWFYFGWIKDPGQWRNVKVAAALQFSVIGWGLLLVNAYQLELIGAMITISTVVLLCIEIFVTMGIVLWRCKERSA